MVFLWPVPSDLGEYYGAAYGPYRPAAHTDDIAYGRLQLYGLTKKAAFVSAVEAPPGPLLDIGCAGGQFLSVSAQVNDRSHLGTDVALAPLRYGQSRRYASVWQGAGQHLPLADHSLAVVTMWHVFEHLPSPRVVLEEIRRVLKPGGVLVVALPLVDSLAARLFGQYWAGYDMPRHLFVYSRATIRAMLALHGFSAVEVPGLVMGFNSARVSAAIWLRAALPRLVRYVPVRWVPLLAGVLLCGVVRLLGILGRNRDDVGVFVVRPAERS